MHEFLRMGWEALACIKAESDPDFRDELRRRSWRGLRTIGWALVIVPTVMTLLVHLVNPGNTSPAGSNWLALGVVTVGAATLAIQRSGRLYDYARPIAFAVVVAVSWCLICGSIFRAATQELFLYLINGQVAVIVLIALMTVPFRPIQVFLIGLFAELFFFAFYRAAVKLTLVPHDPAGDLNLIFLSMLTVLSTVVSISQYRQQKETFESHQLQLQASNELRDSQCRMILSDNAATMGRLAAALSHELNNPLGVLKSSLDTMRSLLLNQHELPPEKKAQMEEMKVTLCRNAQESVDRMQDTVLRMQRFTNLDRAEVLAVDINQLLRDVSGLVKDAVNSPVRFDLELGIVPDLEVRPQLISAVFSALLTNAAEASPEGGVVWVRTTLAEKTLKIHIADQGKGLTPIELREVMEPAFRVRGGRVASCNWNLFAARQIIRQHGGDIVLSSEPGQGTRVDVTLPAERLILAAGA